MEPVATTQNLDDTVLTGIAVDASRVYWVETPGEAVIIHVAAVAGGQDTTLVTAATGGTAGWIRLALDDTSVYWTSYGTGTVARAAK